MRCFHFRKNSPKGKRIRVVVANPPEGDDAQAAPSIVHPGCAIDLSEKTYMPYVPGSDKAAAAAAREELERDPEARLGPKEVIPPALRA